MNTWLEFYQHIPFHINPEIFRIGPFSIGWYAVSYIAAFVIVYGLLKKRLNNGECRNLFQSSNSRSLIKIKNRLRENGNNKILFDFLLFCFLGLVIGARLGYVFFYNFSFYFSNPLAVISPFDFYTGKFIGIYGMSYHGGLIGVLIFGIIFTKNHKLSFWKISDFIIPVVPAGYFFGRMGNFLNGELYGRVTEKWWGMYFPSSVETQLIASLQLRHPSQLYEAFLEGFLLFIIFWNIRNKKIFQGKFLTLYLIGYALMRLVSEFFRQPDEQIGFFFGSLTLGQLFSLLMFFFGLALFFWKKNKIVVQ
ncbi:MAG TPA: prolipoprotein diacylglyceryl transferase [Candidatus Moranbacteria bacterium]|nr:prolipoprotein diacylglyceryl transferase [Candidatus Moranbacteria bacterium]HAT74696.1 prolipoprotein diacylglyceryl transferase [Candidatus Moranbacteria bacterium]